MPNRRQIELKKLYYLDHFNEMLDFVLSYNRCLLDESHRDFIDRFRGQALEDQCLFVRLVNRKGSVFRLDRMVYEEIPDLDGGIARLKNVGLFRDLMVEDFEDYLGCASRLELLALIKDESGIRRSAKKSEIIEFVCRNLDFSKVLQHPAMPLALALDSREELEFLLFLFFGRLEDGLSVFALRDLGIVKTRDSKSVFQSRFSCKEHAFAAFHYRKIRNQIGNLENADLKRLALEVEDWPKVDDQEVTASRHRAIYKLGRALERRGFSELALTVFLNSNQFPCTERSVRLLYQAGQREFAKGRLLKLIENPSTDEELIFAEDFFERKFGQRKVSRLTELLRNSRVLPLDESGREYPEAAAVLYLERNGGKAFHVENAIWTQLFGIVFWDVLFGSDSASIYSDFDRLPAGLNSEIFYIENENLIEQRILEVSIPGWFERQLTKVLESLADNPNGLLYPDPLMFELVQRLVDDSPVGALEIILREMARSFRDNRCGFPDLVVFESGGVSLIEIKAEGDQIQRHQLAQIEKLRSAGFQVEVARIQWTVDPEQEYVVVDVETTGGSSTWNRVTEIGAVRVRGRTIVAEWSSLINPERKIPANIVHLTGITDAMVSNAPSFSGIADEFREFLGDAVFVGHRVKFDFGFIRDEYRRIDQDLRAATFCTVAETRRHFPELKSFGLANLCQEFEINLNSHHRALCDARATAELLLKINDKRRED